MYILILLKSYSRPEMSDIIITIIEKDSLVKE